MKLSITLYKKNIANDVAAELNLMGRTMETTAAAGSTQGEDASASIRELAGFIKSPDDDETKPVMARAMTEGWSSVKEACQRYLILGRDTDDNRLENIFGVKEDSFIPFKGSVWNSDDSWSTTKVDGYTVIPIQNDCVLKKGTKYTLCMDLSGLSISGQSNDIALFIAGDNVIQLGKISDLTSSNKVTLACIADYSGTSYLGFATSESLAVGTAIAAGSAVFSTRYNEWGEYDLALEMPESYNAGVTSAITAYAHRHIVDTVIAAILKNQQVEAYTKYLATAETARQALVRALQARATFTRRTHDWA